MILDLIPMVGCPRWSKDPMTHWKRGLNIWNNCSKGVEWATTLPQAWAIPSTIDKNRPSVLTSFLKFIGLWYCVFHSDAFQLSRWKSKKNSSNISKYRGRFLSKVKVIAHGFIFIVTTEEDQALVDRLKPVSVELLPGVHTFTEALALSCQILVELSSIPTMGSTTSSPLGDDFSLLGMESF